MPSTFARIKITFFIVMNMTSAPIFFWFAKLDHMSRNGWITPTWSHVARATRSHVADSLDHVRIWSHVATRIRSHVATGSLIAPTWSHVADEVEISLSRYHFTVLNYQSTHFVSHAHFNTLALYCVKVLGRTPPLYHFNALK